MDDDKKPFVQNEGEPIKVQNQEGEGNKEGEGEGNKGQQATPFKAFTTEEEYEAAITEEVAKRTPAPAPQEPAKKDESGNEPVSLFPADWKPKDWNDFGLALLTNPAARKILAQQIAPELQTMSQAEQAEMARINDEYDKEYNELAKQGLIPALGTKEGQAINQQISLIGATYGMTSINKAYELWKKIPVAQGGGFDYVPEQKQRLNQQKQRAGMVGGSSGAGSPQAPKKDYKTLHSTSLDTLVQEGMDK